MAKKSQSPKELGVSELSVETVYRVAGKEFKSPQEAQQYLTAKAQEAEAGRAKKLTSSIMSRVRANRRNAVREGVEYMVGLLLRDAALRSSFHTATPAPASPPAPSKSVAAKPAAKPAQAKKAVSVPVGKVKSQPKEPSKKAGTKSVGAGPNLDSLTPPGAGVPPPPPPDIVKASQAA